MTLDELKARPDFITELTDEQRAWTLAYCSNGGRKMEATQNAYPKCKSDASQRVQAGRCLAHPVIKRIISDYFDRVDETGNKERLLAELWRRMMGTADDKMFRDLAVVYVKVKGYEAEKPAKEEPETPSSNIDAILKEL